MLDGNSLVEFLQERGFSTLCHVNTAATALTFLRNGGLLSRQYVEEHPETCFQTSQDSDQIDQNFGIFNDIFFDAEDIWGHGGMKYCYYGPIAFYYDVEILSEFSNIYVSRENPLYWKKGCFSDNCFIDINELKNKIQSSIYAWPIAHHIIMHDQGVLNFGNSLRKVLFWGPDINIAGCHKDYIINMYNTFAGLCNDMEIDFDYKAMKSYKWNQIVDECKIYKFYYI